MKLAQTGKGEDNTLLYVVLGAAGVAALYLIFGPKEEKKPEPSVTRAGELPPREAPETYASLTEVSTRFDQMRELWTMGYMGPEEALLELDVLQNAVVDLVDGGIADTAAGVQLVGRIEAQRERIEEWVQETTGAFPA